MKDTYISENIKYIGADDKDIRLFESQYVVPNGISYNSYLINDEKTLALDTIDEHKTSEWLENLEKELYGKSLDYLVISHMESDHAYNIGLIAKKYPKMKLIGNAITFKILSQFFEIENLEQRKILVKDGDILNIGKHTLQFFIAPMVHWPEVMVTYEQTEKILFTADAFGKFGTLDTQEDWVCEARRYYFGIVGKYGAQVQALLKKVANLDIKIICPLHGPILKENLSYYINKYDIWSSYIPEDDGIVIAYASIHGNTKTVVNKLVSILKEKGTKNIITSDLARCDMSEAIEDAFRYNKLVLAASTYNGGVFTPMEQFLNHLSHRNYQNRVIGIIENGSWAPSAAKTIAELLKDCKNIEIKQPIITIKSTLKEENIVALETLANNLL